MHYQTVLAVLLLLIPTADAQQQKPIHTFNGDGSLFCGGPDGPITTIRFENVRDGIEDHELLRLLAQRLGDGGKESRSLCDELIPTLTTFTRDVRKFAEVRLRLLRQLAEQMTR